MQQETNLPHENQLDISSDDDIDVFDVDLEMLQQIRQVIESKFDLEIKRRQDQIESINRQLREANIMKEKLERFWKQLNEDQTKEFLQELEDTKNKNKKRKHETTNTLILKNDGDYVQMICQECKRVTFRDIEGFLLHMDLIHDIQYSTKKEAIAACGVPTDERPIKPKKPKLKKRKKIIKRIVVGNTSRYIPEERREATDNYTHRWMIYIRGPNEEPDITSFVKMIRVFLHPSFAPNDVVDLYTPPFHITRRGWGEFPVKVQLYFTDPNNKPIEITHQLRLDKENTRREIISPETHVDIELESFESSSESETESDEVVQDHEDFESQSETQMETETDMESEVQEESSSEKEEKSKSKKKKEIKKKEKKEVKKKKKDEKRREEKRKEEKKKKTKEEKTEEGEGKKKKDKKKKEKKRKISKPPFPPTSNHPLIMYNILNRELTEEEKWIREGAKKFPIVTFDMKVPYLSAKDDDTLVSWTVGKRKAAERLRAIRIGEYVSKKFNCHWPTTKIMSFCREAGFTPIVKHNESVLDILNQQDKRGMSPSSSKKRQHREEVIQYFCKYCGSAHKPQSDFNASQEKCRKRLKIELSQNGKTVDEILSESKEIEEEEVSYQPIKIEKKPEYIKALNECHQLHKEEVDCVKHILSQINLKFEYNDDVDQKLTEMAFVKIANVFVKSLINESINVYNEQKQHEQSSSAEKILTPVHTYLAIHKNEDFDFLTNLKKSV